MFRHFKWNLVAWLFLSLPRLIQGQEGVTNAFDDLERQGTVENEEYCEMRQVVSSDEMEMLIQENPVTGYFCFTEDRMHDIRMTDAIPQRWIDRPGEFYTWQVGVFAPYKTLSDVSVSFPTGKMKKEIRYPLLYSAVFIWEERSRMGNRFKSEWM